MTINRKHAAVPALILLMLALSPLETRAANTALLELIQILRNKGSITEQEYQLLQQAAAADAGPGAVSASPAPASEPVVAAAKPAPAAPLSTLELKGDVRVRYQNEQEQAGDGRDRGRLRYRLGATAKPSEGWEVGAGLASGSADPRSTNQSFTGSFTKKAINLDYAYAQYQLGDHLKLIGGKFRSPAYLYTVSDLMWDTDVNPEGVSANYSLKSGSGTTFVNSGLWVLEEKSASAQDPYMAYLQLGHGWSGDQAFATLAGTWYSFEDNSGPGAFSTAGSNTDHQFSGIYSLAGEIGMTDLLTGGTRFSLVGELVDNTDTGTAEDFGYLLGFKGAYDVWSFRYNYARLDRNAWPDLLPDSDRYEGLTGIRGHEFLLEYAVMKNVLLGLNYYLSERTTTGIDQDLLQLDLNVKF